MNITVQTKSGQPIYEQIERQMKDAILRETLLWGRLCRPSACSRRT